MNQPFPGYSTQDFFFFHSVLEWCGLTYGLIILPAIYTRTATLHGSLLKQQTVSMCGLGIVACPCLPGLQALWFWAVELK